MQVFAKNNTVQYSCLSFLKKMESTRRAGMQVFAKNRAERNGSSNKFNTVQEQYLCFL